VLLQRTTRRLSLTPQEVYVALSGAAGTGAQRQSGDGAAARGPGGRVRITAPEATGTLLLGRILAEFRALYPEVVLELTLAMNSWIWWGKVTIWRCGRRR
jgi:DNA-binding transcriptional LysR family regulator